MTQQAQSEAGRGAAAGAATEAGAAIGAAYGYSKGRRADKRAREAENKRAAADAATARSILLEQQIMRASSISPELAQQVQQAQSLSGGPLAPEQWAQLQQQWQTKGAQDAMLRQINDYYMNPALAQQTQAYLNQQQQDSLGQLKDQSRLATRGSAFNTSRAGVKGSSMEAEQGAALRAAQQQGVADTVAARAGGEAQIMAGRRNQRARLTQVALEDPTQRQSAAALQGVQQQGAMEGEQANVQAGFRQVQQGAAQNYANILAGGIRGLAGSYRAANRYEGA